MWRPGEPTMSPMKSVRIGEDCNPRSFSRKKELQAITCGGWLRIAINSKWSGLLGRAHKLAIRSTPEIRYGSNGVRNHTCLEVPLRHLLSSPEQVPSNRRQESMAQR